MAEEKSDKHIVAYYQYHQTSIELCFDDEEERGYPKTSGSSTIEIKNFKHEEIQKAFDEEDGDGDDCGSWSRNIIMITDTTNKLLWYPQSLLNKLQRRYPKASPQNLSKMYDEMLEQKIAHIKAGVF